MSLLSVSGRLTGAVVKRQRVDVSSTALWVAIVGGLASIGAAFIPAWFDARLKARAATEAINKHGDPLLRAAHDLQRRLYQILCGGFLRRYAGNESSEAEASTLWLLGQYLGWVEILRREVQFMDLGTARQNRRLQDGLAEVSSALAGTASDPFALSEAEQQAFGEAMIKEPQKDDPEPTARPLSYGEFVQLSADTNSDRETAGDPVLRGLRQKFAQALPKLDKGRSREQLADLQGALVDVVNMLDQYQVRFPRLDDRAKVPRSNGVEVDREMLLARFDTTARAEKINEKIKTFETETGLHRVDTGTDGGSDDTAVHHLQRKLRLGGSFDVVVKSKRRVLTIEAFMMEPRWLTWFRATVTRQKEAQA